MYTLCKLTVLRVNRQWLGQARHTSDWDVPRGWWLSSLTQKNKCFLPAPVAALPGRTLAAVFPAAEVSRPTPPAVQSPGFESAPGRTGPAQSRAPHLCVRLKCSDTSTQGRLPL